MSKNTMTDMVTELEKLSPSHLRDQLIVKAKAGDFHDYRSSATCGKMYFLECAIWFKKNIWKYAPDYSIEGDVDKMSKMEVDIKNGDYDEVYTEFDGVFIRNQAEKDSTLSEEDKAFVKVAFASRTKKGKHGKNYFN